MNITNSSVNYFNHMGSDLDVVNAARVSFDKESQWEVAAGYRRYDTGILSEKDQKLIHYLAKHNHWTPFGHTSISLRIKAPIFVARQLGKHQVGFVWNEVSRRYVDSEPEFYIPDAWRKRAENVKQGSADEAVEEPVDVWVKNFTSEALSFYKDLLKAEVCPEQARMILPQNMMTEWIWTGSLAAYARVCKLRLDPHTQKETRHIAALISDECAKLFPISWNALCS